jgi:hypothetical protein
MLRGSLVFTLGFNWLALIFRSSSHLRRLFRAVAGHTLEKKLIASRNFPYMPERIRCANGMRFKGRSEVPEHLLGDWCHILCSTRPRESRHTFGTWK